jgi:hypothetical protein
LESLFLQEYQELELVQPLAVEIDHFLFSIVNALEYRPVNLGELVELSENDKLLLKIL